jgi:hypothetical protein
MAKPANLFDPPAEYKIPASKRPEYMGVAARFHAALLNVRYEEDGPSIIAGYAFDHADSFFAELDRRTKK